MRWTNLKIISISILCLVILQLSASADLKEAITDYRNNNLTAALNALDRSNFAGPDADLADFMRGQIYLDKFQPEAARVYFSRALEDEKFILHDYAEFLSAKSFELDHQYAKSIAAFEDFTLANPSSTLVPDAFIETGLCRIELGQFKPAINSYRRVINNFPDSYLVDQAYYLIGEAYEKMGYHRKAAEIYQNLNLEKPLSSYVTKAFARLEELSKANKIPPTFLTGGQSFTQAVRFFDLKKYKTAEKIFKQIASRAPRSKYADDALVMAGRCEYRRGRPAKAIALFNRAIAYNGSAADEAQYYKAYSYILLGNADRAIAAYRKVIANYPKSPLAPESQYYIGNYYEAGNMTASAIKAYADLIKNFSQSDWMDSAAFRLGLLYYRNNDFASASKSFSYGADLDPPGEFSEKCLYWMAKSAEKNNNQDEANNIYQKLAQRFDHSYFSYRAKENLAKQGINIESKTPQLNEEELPLVFMVPDKQYDITERDEILDIWGNLGYKGTAASVSKAAGKEGHAAKYKALMQLGMAKYAAKEAAEVVIRSAQKEKNNAKANLGMALLSAGEYATPVHFADGIVKSAILNGNANDLSYYMWQLAYPRGFWYEVNSYAQRYNIDPYLLLSIIREESNFKTSATSRAYAMGLMQILPRTGRGIARFLGIRPYSTASLQNPSVNISMGAYFFSYLLNRFNGNITLAVAAYNGGPERVSRWQEEWEQAKGKDFDMDEFVESIPLRETKYYIQKVLNSYYEYKRLYGNKG